MNHPGSKPDSPGTSDPRVVRRDRVTDGGILVVGVAAAILTFTTLRDLAVAVGITGELAGLKLSWLLPICIDAAGIVAARVWLRGQTGKEAVAFARRLALSCIGLSVSANGGQHLMSSLHVVPEWWVIVLVTSVPPAMLGAVVHLGHLLGREDRAERSPDRATVGDLVAQTAVAAAHESVHEAVQMTDAGPVYVPASRPVETGEFGPGDGPVDPPGQPTAEMTADDRSDQASDRAAETESDRAGDADLDRAETDSQTGQDDRAETVEQTGQEAGEETGPDRAGDKLSAGDDEVLDWLRERATKTGQVPGREEMLARYRMGSGRADRLRSEVPAPGKLRRVK